MIPNTAQDKAIELYTKHESLIKDFTKGVSIKELTKESAMISANEGMNAAESLHRIEWWEKVIKELNKL